MDLPRGAIGPRESVPVFLRKPIATCDVAGGGGGERVQTPCSAPSTHDVLNKDILIYISEKKSIIKDNADDRSLSIRSRHNTMY